MAITFRQTNPIHLTSVHSLTQNVISPLASGDFLQEVPITSSFSEYLFEMTKDGRVFWVGAAVPAGTTDFSRAQVFFHPTPIQKQHHVIAADGDYPAFRGGWTDHIQHYVALEGSQLAAARLTPLIVPFMTMAAFAGGAPYMFDSRPVETLNAILTAVRNAALPSPAIAPVRAARIGVSSFSSGIGAMRLFIRTLGGNLIVETTDFDGPFITAEPKVITRAPGAVGRVFSQIPPHHPQPGYVTLLAKKFANIATRRDKGVHSQIGGMMFFTAALGSTV